MADQAPTKSNNGKGDGDNASATSPSPIPTSTAPSGESSSEPSGIIMNSNSHHHNEEPTNAADDDNDNDENDYYYSGTTTNGANEPLLSSLFEKSIKMGPFSIKYNNPKSPRVKPSRLYDDEANNSNSGSSSFYHDFVVESSDSHCLYNQDDDDDDDDDDDGIQHYRSKRASYKKMILRKLLASLSCCKAKILPLRILLLAFYLAFTLSSFWILDSIKEPTLAILVNGELGKHQPRAKMVSFVVVVCLAVGMEAADRARHERRRKRRRERRLLQSRGSEDVAEEDANAALQKSWEDRNLPHSMRENEYEGGSRWKKMGVRTSQLFRNHFRRGGRSSENEPAEDASSSKIGTLAFYVVGSLYVHFFITVAVALRRHPSFRPTKSIFREANDAADLAADGIDAHPSGDLDASNDASSANIHEEERNTWYYPALGYALFALIESFGSVSITIFWAFANSHLTLETAERHYGSIIALAQGGAIAGSTLSAMMGRRRDRQQDNIMVISDGEDRVDVDVNVADAGGGVGENNDAQVTPLLIFWACGCIGCGMAIMALYGQLFSKPMQQSRRTNAGEGHEIVDGDDAPKIVQSATRQKDCDDMDSGSRGKNSMSKDLFGGVHMIFRHEYLKLVLAVSVLYEIALTCMHYEMNLIGLDRFGVGISIVDESDFHDDYNPDSNNENSNNENSSSGGDEGITYIQFMGWYGQTVNILSLFLSFYAFPRLIKNYGLRFTIRVFPTVLLLVTIFAFVLFPENLYFLFVSLSICKALTYSVHDPSEEVLYMPTSDDAKFRAKFWIDVVGQRIAKAIGSVINNYAGSVKEIVKYGSLPSVVASLALWLACYQVGILFDDLIKTGGVVGLEDEEAEEQNEGEGGCLELSEGLEYDDDENNGNVGLEEESSKVETTLL